MSATPVTTRATPAITLPVSRSSPKAAAVSMVKTGAVLAMGATTTTLPSRSAP